MENTDMKKFFSKSRVQQQAEILKIV